MNFDFRSWVDYFKNNKGNLHSIEWSEGYQLSSHEYHTIYQSLQQFQVGERSEGKFLIKSTKRYLSKMKDHSYLQAIILFIHEEQRHAKELARFMEKQQIPTIRKHWVDQVFRKLRRFASLEQSITVLLTAELIATVYYDALKRSTKSKVLRGICEQILDDEAKHVEFQSVALHQMSNNRKKVTKGIVKAIRMSLFLGTLIIVWFQHHKVFRAGGYGVVKYFKYALLEYRRAEKIINQ
ncbi:MAG: ferritin-like domain-containing protein [Anaerobacillus sp.]